jgi:serine/threonine protein kinase
MELLQAASCGNLRELQRLLKTDLQPDLLDGEDLVNFSSKGWTCLHFACLSGHSEVVKFLVSQGADCNYASHDEWTPLQLAAYHGHVSAISALLAHPNIQVNKQTSSRPTALHIAVSAGYSEIIRKLLEAGASMSVEDSQGKTPIETTDDEEILSQLPLYMGVCFLQKYAAVPALYGAQLFYRNNFLLNDRYVYLYLSLHTGFLIRYSSEIDFRKGARPKRLMKLDEIQEVKVVSRGFFDRTQIFFFLVKTRDMQRKYYTYSEAETNAWVSRIKQAVEYSQTHTPQLQMDCSSDTSSSKRESTEVSEEVDDCYNTEVDVVSKARVECPLVHEKISLSSFAVIRELGAGNFGKVYKAVKKNTGEVVAIKALSKKYLQSKKQLKYAINEVRVMKRLDHPNIVQLKCCFQTKRFLYLVLELCPNGDLGMHLHHSKKFDEDRARFYIAQTMQAVEYLHNRDIVYRDLKPDNILLDSKGNAKLTDFGLVRDQLTCTYGVSASFCGSPFYMPPEMIQDQISSKAGDIYSLGVVLYEMVTGKLPFISDNKQSLFKRIINKELTYPSHVSKTARSFINAAMRKDPSERPCIQTMQGHPFMRPIDWERLERGQLNPPLLDQSWTQSTIDESPVEWSVLEALTVDVDEIDEANIVKEFVQSP